MAWNLDLKCPKCETEHSGYDLLYGTDYKDGEVYEVDCPDCGQELTIRVSVDLIFDIIEVTEHENPSPQS